MDQGGTILLEDFGQRVDLTWRIRELLANYPEGTPTLRELIQNADDTGASRVRLCIDRRGHGAYSLLAPALAQWQGLALLAHNDAAFTDDDFASISRIDHFGLSSALVTHSSISVFLSEAQMDDNVLNLELKATHLVTTSIYNLILGKLYCDHYGTMRIQGNREYSCKPKFKEQSIIDRNPHRVQGVIQDRNGRTVATLFGKWDESMHYVMGDCFGKGKGSENFLEAHLLWKSSKPPKFPTRYNFTSFAITLNELTPRLKVRVLALGAYALVAYVHMLEPSLNMIDKIEDIFETLGTTLSSIKTKKVETPARKGPCFINLHNVPQPETSIPIAKGVETVKTLEEIPLLSIIRNEIPIGLTTFAFSPRSVATKPLFQSPLKTSCIIEELFDDLDDGSIDTT
ncbi:Oxysterol-binding protein-related protein 7 [Hordeum vulgare]|nr:Oxysterol-binding protein-related protein 7 [Hordeum vulgare]